MNKAEYESNHKMLDEIENALDGKASLDKQGNLVVKINQEPRTDLPPLVGYGDTVNAGDIVNIYYSGELSA